MVPPITWTHLTPELVDLMNPVLIAKGKPPLEPGELLSYPQFRALALWEIDEREYVTELEALWADEGR